MDSENNILRDKKLFNISNQNLKSTIMIYISLISNIVCLIFFLFLSYKNNESLKEITKESKIIVEVLNSNYQDKLNENNIQEKIKLLKYMTNNNELKYKGVLNCLLNDPDNQLCIYHLLSPKKVVDKKRILLGAKRDGCYVLLDDFENIKIAYSFGISRMIQFDLELANKGIDVYMYDHTITSLPYNHNKFHWKKIGISGKDSNNKNLESLEQILIDNNHINEKNMILKIDVEHWEWEALKDLPDSFLTKFKYIVIEFHFTKPEKEANLYYNVLEKIHKYHQAFYFRCNGRNNIVQFGNNRICKFIEVSYIIREGHIFEKDNSIYPIFEFDYAGPNTNEKTEIEVNILTLFN